MYNPFKQSATPFRKLATKADLNSAIEMSGEAPVVLFKHSQICSLSARAFREMQTMDAATDPPVFMLVVQRSRDLSNTIESDFGIRHESPQVIVLSEGRPVHNASHRTVSADHVRTVIEDIVPTEDI